MNNPKVTIGVLLFKEEKYLSYSLASLLDQDYKNIEFIFRDQSPSGEVYDYLAHAHPKFFQKATIKKGKNLMHCGGHNVLIREMMKNGSEYYMCVSNDMLYPRDFVSHLIRGMEGSEPRHYVGTCKLIQWDYEKVLKGDLEGSKTDKVDSFGIGISRNHLFYDIGQGHEEKEVEIPKKMLGPSGALAVFHKKALEAIAYRNKKGEIEYFDENLHYKGDCDLAYRLSWAGFPCYLAKDVKVYHDRQVGEKGRGAVGKLKDHQTMTKWAKNSSLKGHLITVRKNFDTNFSLTVKCLTYMTCLARFLYTLFLSPNSLKIYKEVRKLKPEIQRRKYAIKKEVSVTDIESLMS